MDGKSFMSKHLRQLQSITIQKPQFLSRPFRIEDSANIINGNDELANGFNVIASVVFEIVIYKLRAIVDNVIANVHSHPETPYSHIKFHGTILIFVVFVLEILNAFVILFISQISMWHQSFY